MSSATVLAIVVVTLGLALILVAAKFAPRLELLPRLAAIVALTPVILFCALGFLATFEPLEPSIQTTWRVIYVVLGLSCFAAIVRLASAGKKMAA